DDTVGVLRSFGGRIEWTSEPDGGQARGINLGFSEVNSEVMAYLNSDDILLPGALAYVGNHFIRSPDVDLIYGQRVFIDHTGREIGRCILPEHDPIALLWADFIPQETLFWRRPVWLKVGPLDESFKYAMDWDFILRAQE